MSNFNLEYANNLPINECKDYIIQYFYPLATSQHIFISYDTDGKASYEVKEDITIKKVYFNRLPKDVCDFYFKKYDKIKTLTCELNKPMLFDNFFNSCPEFLHKVKPYEDFAPEIKSKVQTMLSYLKTVWASNNNEHYQFILKWLSNMARGGKNQSVLYLRSEEGVGKSTFTDFLMKHVIGPKLSLMSGSAPLLSNFNIILYCKLLVVYEELENFSTSQWQVVSSRIKRDVTSTTCTYEKKNETSFVGKNINNLILNSNVDAIKNDEGRRYFILDLNNEKKGDIKFWDNVYSCMRDDVGDAMFSYLHTVDLTDYHDQAFPSTQSKHDAIVKRLDSVARFIKESYVLRNKDMNIQLQELYNDYKRFCNGGRTECKIEFNSKLAKYKIEGKKSGNFHNKFCYKVEQLKVIAETNKWLHHTDSYELTEDQFDDLDNGIKDLNNDDNERGKAPALTEDKKTLFFYQSDEDINTLKKQVEALNNKIKEIENKPPQIIDHHQIIMDEMLKEQKEMNEYLKAHVKPKKKTKKDPKIFELFLNDLDDLCN